MKFKGFAAALVCAVYFASVMVGAAQPPQPGSGGKMGSQVHSMPKMTGPVVGNKKSKIYHLPGDKGSMPAAKNRVYFRTEQEAVAAGYHPAKQKRAKPHVSSVHGAKMGGHTAPAP